MKVACGTTITDVPPTTAVLPTMPEGASDIGILVDSGMITKLDPPMTTVEGCPACGCGPAGGCEGAAIVVGPGRTITGVLFITSVIPLAPEGAPARGMVVAADMVIGESGGAGLMNELIIDPIGGAGGDDGDADDGFCWSEAGAVLGGGGAAVEVSGDEGALVDVSTGGAGVVGVSTGGGAAVVVPGGGEVLEGPSSGVVITSCVVCGGPMIGALT
jgi:hypothetical protein